MKNLKVGLQLYSVRERLEADMEATLAAVKAAGYDYVEFANFYGRSAEEIRAMLDRHGLRCISVHRRCDPFLSDAETNIRELRTVGAEYCAIPYMSPERQKGGAEFELAEREIRKTSALLKQNGIQLMYHNHEHEFETYEGKFLLDWLYESFGTDVLEPEIDTCWVRYAGYDPCKYIEKYSGRINIVHLKDFVSEATVAERKAEGFAAPTREDNKFRFRPVGEGMQDFPSVLEAVSRAGAGYVIVEQDSSYDEDPIECAARSRAYLRKLGI